MRHIALLVLPFLSGTTSAIPAGDCGCREESERWQKAKEKVKNLEKQIQDLGKAIQSSEKRVDTLENEMAALREKLKELEKIVDAQFWAALGGNPIANALLLNAQAQWMVLKITRDTLFMVLDAQPAMLLIPFSKNFFDQFALTWSLISMVRSSFAQGLGAAAGITGLPSPNSGAYTLLEWYLSKYAEKMLELATTMIALGAEKQILDLYRKELPRLQEELEKARAEEEAARKAFELCLAENHGGQFCAKAVALPTATLKDKTVDLVTVDVLADTWLTSTSVSKK